MKFIFIFILVYSIFAKAEDSEKTRRRIQDLYIWKISDELKLTVKEEKQVGDIFKEINKEKSQNLQKINSLVSEMEQIKDSKKYKSTLTEYKKLLSQYNAINLEEIEKIEVALGSERTIKYIAVKSDITSNVKKLLLQNDDKENKPKSILSAPKIIEE